tara:strand:- start:133 stop:309 length:177 start_codon:yes stop_codon:yes gene_type:complete
MLNKEVQKFIEENDLVRIQASPMSEASDLWECPGGHVWNWEMIQEAIKMKNLLCSSER